MLCMISRLPDEKIFRGLIIKEKTKYLFHQCFGIDIKKMLQSYKEQENHLSDFKVIAVIEGDKNYLGRIMPTLNNKKA